MQRNSYSGALCFATANAHSQIENELLAVVDRRIRSPHQLVRLVVGIWRATASFKLVPRANSSNHRSHSRVAKGEQQ